MHLIKIDFNFILGDNFEPSFNEILNTPKHLAKIDHLTQSLAQRVRSSDSLSEKERVKIDLFISRISLLDQKCQEALTESPIHGSVQKLSSCFHQFSKKTSKAKGQPSLSSATLEKTFREKLQHLDLNSPSLSSDIAELTRLLGKLKENKFIESSHFFQLTAALKDLKENNYRPSFSENLCHQFLGEKSSSFKTALEASTTSLRQLELHGKNAMLKHLKASSHLSLQQLASSIPSQTQKINNQLTSERLKILATTMGLSENEAETFANNFLLFQKNVDQFCTLLHENYEKCFDESKKHFGKFGNEQEISEKLELYPDMHPLKSFTSRMNFSLEWYFTNLQVSDFKRPFEDFKHTMQAMMGEIHSVTSYCIRDYNSCFLLRIKWFVQNFSRIKQFYNQGEDTSRNVGEGTCFQNSLGLYHWLLSNGPNTPGEQIPAMGSSDLGRALQARHNALLNMEKNGVLAWGSTLQAQFSSSEKHHLKERVPLKHYDSIKSLIEASQTSTDPFFCIINMFGTDGHAIILQVDHKAGIFRIIDDNLGVCEWNSFAEFQKQFADYISIRYSDMNLFTTQFYDLT